MMRSTLVGRLRLVLLLPLLLIVAGVAYAEPPLMAIKASLVLKVADRDQAASHLLDKTNELGGYFASLSDNGLQLRLPVAQVQRFLTYATSLGVVADRRFDSEDLSLTLAKQRALYESHRQLLKRYFDVLREADSSQVIVVEKETLHLIEELEQLKGAIQQAEHQLSLATVAIDFQFREREGPRRDGHSSFAWLNRLNLSDLRSDFRDAK